MSLRYRVVETMTVTDEALDRIMNAEAAAGWTLESIRFAMSDASRRPAMAFVIFTREVEIADEAS